MRRVLTAIAAVALVASLSACTGESDDLAALYREGSNQGFISGDGSVEEIPADRRGEPLVFAGTAVDGSAVSEADFAGQVLVINFWYALCGPCRTEAPILEAVHQQTTSDASFLGVNIYDGADQATSFEQKYGITYPSLLARGDADLKLAFASSTTLSAAPTTIVLDTDGRVAARFVGAVRSESVLRTIVDDLAAEGS